MADETTLKMTDEDILCRMEKAERALGPGGGYGEPPTMREWYDAISEVYEHRLLVASLRAEGCGG